MTPQEYKELIKKDTIKIGQDIDALIKQGYKVKRLRPRRPRKGELVMSMTKGIRTNTNSCLLYTSPSPRDGLLSRMPSSA